MLSPLTRTSTIYKRKKKIEAAELCDCEKDKRQLINYKNYYNNINILLLMLLRSKNDNQVN